LFFGGLQSQKRFTLKSGGANTFEATEKWVDMSAEKKDGVGRRSSLIRGSSMLNLEDAPPHHDGHLSPIRYAESFGGTPCANADGKFQGNIFSGRKSMTGSHRGNARQGRG
jgi:hypothetical protein